MLVQTILNGKDDDSVVTVTMGSSVSDAAALLSSRRIGTVVISDDGSTPMGILSERDIVRELGRRGVGCMSEKVEDMMTSKIVTCAASDTADKVLGDMTAGRFRHMPVMDGDQMIGLISIGDVVKARLNELSMEKEALQDMVMGR